MLTLGLKMLPEKKGKYGNFSQDGDPALPQFGNPMFVKKKKLWLILHFRTLGTFLIFTKMFSFWVVLWFVEVGMGDPTPSSEKFPLHPVLFDF